MGREIIIDVCGECPCMFSVAERIGCRLDGSEDPERAVVIDPDFMEDVPSNCPLFGGVWLRLPEGIDPRAEDDVDADERGPEKEAE